MQRICKIYFQQINFDATKLIRAVWPVLIKFRGTRARARALGAFADTGDTLPFLFFTFFLSLRPYNRGAKCNPKYSSRSTRRLSGEQEANKNPPPFHRCLVAFLLRAFKSVRARAPHPSVFVHRLGCNLIFHTYENLNPEIMSGRCPKRNKPRESL